MGGGSGSSSGKVGYPAYVELLHGLMVNHGGLDIVGVSMVDAMNASFGASPYAAMVPYDPTTALTAIDTEVVDFQTLIDAVDLPDELTDTEINAEISAYRAQTEDELVSNVLPRFQAGMRDIGAVVSSAFVEGQSILEDGQSKDVNKFAAALRLKAKASEVERASLMLKQVEAKNMVSSLIFNAEKLRIATEKTELDQEYSFDIGDAKWDLELFQHGANLIASPSGAGVNTKSVTGGNPIELLVNSGIG